jgi:hypothetical protein
MSNRNADSLTRAAAHHEASHVVVGNYFHKHVRDRGIGVSVDRPGLGFAHLKSEILQPINECVDDAHATYTRGRLRSECIEYLAGAAAEWYGMGRQWQHDGAATDFARTASLIQRVMSLGAQEATGMISLFYLPSAKRLVRRPDIWAAIQVVANALLEHQYLDSDAANDLLDRCQIPQVSMRYWDQWG